MSDYIPKSDQDLEAWAVNYSSLITAGPTAYGLTSAIATTLAGKLSAYSTALAAATNPATRGGATVLAKDTAQSDLVNYCRQLARAIQGTMTVTNAQRFALGLTVRDTTPSPIPPPADAPDVMVLSTIGNTVRIRLVDPANPTRRGKPAGVKGASVFSFVGAVAPTDEAGWKFEGNLTRTTVNIIFPNTTPAGAKVWFTAFWRNPRDLSGPAAAPVCTNIPGGAAMAA